jgi:plasmid maintenance system antidote protein VapI
MLKISSLTGRYLVQLIDQYFPSSYGERGIQTQAMADSLGISKRSLLAFISEERRVPEEVEARITQRYGEPPADAWRTVTLRQVRRDQKETLQPPKPMVESFWKAERYDGEWRKLAQLSVAEIALKLQKHQMGDWIRHPEDDMDYDWVSMCERCEEIAAIDESAQEISGMAMRVPCERLTVAGRMRA